MSINFYDTSALMILDNLYEGLAYVSPLTLMELEEIKGSRNKTDEQHAMARKALRNIEKCAFTQSNQKNVIKLIKKTNFLMDIPDHRILADAIMLAREIKQQITFITADRALAFFARNFSELKVEFVNPIKENKESWKGWKECYPTEEEMISLYSSPSINILNCKTNEFAMIYEKENLKDILFWNGKTYSKMRYKDMKNPYTQEIVRPRNLQQKMAMHILQNPDIKVKTIYSSWGGGKTLLALTYALEQIAKGHRQKLVFVRNNIVAADTNDIGSKAPLYSNV